MLSAAQAAQVLGIRPTTLRDWVARGHVTRRRRNRYDLAEILTYLEHRHR